MRVIKVINARTVNAGWTFPPITAIITTIVVREYAVHYLTTPVHEGSFR